MDGCLQCFSAGHRITDLLPWRQESNPFLILLTDEGRFPSYFSKIKACNYKCSHDCMSTKTLSNPAAHPREPNHRDLDWKGFSSKCTRTHPAAFLTSRMKVNLVKWAIPPEQVCLKLCGLRNHQWNTWGSSNNHEVEKSPDSHVQDILQCAKKNSCPAPRCKGN